MKGLEKNAFSHIWDYLREDTSIKIIHVIRNNQLHSYISFYLAISQGKWIGDKYDPVKGGLYVDKNRLEQWFRKGDQRIKYFNNYFKDHKILEIHYRDMTDNFTYQMSRVFDFLGHSSDLQIYPGINKQNICKSHEILKNFDTLEEYFANTKWATYFKS